MGWNLYGVLPLCLFILACCLPGIYLKTTLGATGEGALGTLGCIGGLVCCIMCIGVVANMVFWIMNLVWMAGDDCIDSKGIKCY